MKRAKETTVTPSKKPKAGDGIFADVKVLFIARSIQHSTGRVQRWTRSIEDQGGMVAKGSKERGITHVVVGELPYKDGDLPARKGPKRAIIVSAAWLERSLAQQKRQQETDFQPAAPLDEPAGATEDASEHGKLYRYKQWLGYWKPEFDSGLCTQQDLMLQAKFGDGLLENQAIAKVFSLLAKYEGALGPDYNSSKKEALGDKDFNHRAISFAKAAAAVKACAFPITKDLHADQIPFVGEGMVIRIQEILSRGTTDDLEAHRHGWDLKGSDGRLRSKAGSNAVRGGATKYLFTRLPAVGPSAAQVWYDLGLRSLEDVVKETGKGGRLEPRDDNPLRLKPEQAFSLKHRNDLLADCSPEDIDEIKSTVLEVLASFAGSGWVMEAVGGARRGKASHDADFLLSNPDRPHLGVARKLVIELVQRKRMVPAAEGFHRLQDGRMDGHEDVMKHGKSYTSISADSSPSELWVPTNDIKEGWSYSRFDRIFGVFLTSMGHMRRCDLIFVPENERPFALLGWTGSRTYMRLLRHHADSRGMRLNSHWLSVMDKEGKTRLRVPDETAPLDATGKPYWPPGWDAQRPVKCEADIFELLGLPYREPWERKA